jgi:release factor glutamine methyltransferase
LVVATAQLSAVSDTPRLDAELLMAHALGIPRDKLLLWGMDRAVPPEFAPLLARRLRHEPVAYITGTKAFWSIDLAVTPDVLIPRPDSETLIAAAVAHFGERGPRTMLDLGTGSGALLLAALAEWPRTKGLGIDASAAALAVAHNNADHLGLADRARFQLGDWGAGLDEHFDLILCNPPYIETSAALAPNVMDYEPHSALFSGADGLDDYRRVIPQLPSLLVDGGIVCLEIGNTQREAVTALAEAQGFTVTGQQDLGGRDRCLVLSA